MVDNHNGSDHDTIWRWLSQPVGHGRIMITEKRWLMANESLLRILLFKMHNKIGNLSCWFLSLSFDALHSILVPVGAHRIFISHCSSFKAKHSTGSELSSRSRLIITCRPTRLICHRPLVATCRGARFPSHFWCFILLLLLLCLVSLSSSFSSSPFYFSFSSLRS